MEVLARDLGVSVDLCDPSDRYGSLLRMRDALDGVTEHVPVKSGQLGSAMCATCGTNEYTSSYEMQTRCGDEGMTSFITCDKCKSKWREG